MIMSRAAGEQVLTRSSERVEREHPADRSALSAAAGGTVHLHGCKFVEFDGQRKFRRRSDQRQLGSRWTLRPRQLPQLPVAASPAEAAGVEERRRPDERGRRRCFATAA
jgi:hypothetical protein